LTKCEFLNIMRMMSNFCNGVKKRRKIALLVQAVGLILTV